MAKQLINPTSLTPPSGYSNGVLSDGGRWLFLAGQIGMDASGAIAAPGDLVAQFAQALANLQAVVGEAGGQMSDVVKLTIYVTDAAEYRARLKQLGQAYQAVFGRHYPAMTLVEVKGLFDAQALVEVEGLAVLEAA